MSIVITTILLYILGYMLSMLTIYLINRYEHKNGVRDGTLGLGEALSISFLSWVSVIICFIIFFELDDKYDNITNYLDNKFRGIK